MPNLYELTIPLRVWVKPHQVTQWAEHTNVFFVLGMGRSGTAFLANLLDSDPEAYVVHEPVQKDFTAYQEAFHSQDRADDYIVKFRSREMFLRAKRRDRPTYGEVNSTMRRHVYALRRTFPNSCFLHLVRDGRNVVRSMMARLTMTPQDANTAAIRPHPDDPYHEDWSEMDRFARLCWYWRTENAFVREAIGVSIRFENLLSDYAYFSERLLDPCHVEVSQQEWEQAVSKPKNQTTKHRLSGAASWSSELRETFNSICGEEMLANGYDLA